MRSRRVTSLAALCGLAVLLVAPNSSAAQTCSPAPLGTAASKTALRASSVVAVGTLARSAPGDSHGLFSFLLTVDRYIRGAGPPQAEFTIYEGRQATLSALQPGSSISQSRAFATRYGGQQALVASTPETEPFSGQFAVDRCSSYAFYGDAAVNRALPIVERLLKGAPPPKMPRTGGPLAPGLWFGLVAVLGGMALRQRGQRLVVAASHDFLSSASAALGLRRKRAH